MNRHAKAEAIFGSASRGDNDGLSDRDILIVDTDIDLLKDRKRYLEAVGWSVASYTFRKLEALSRQGALFIQHLRLEADVTADVDGHLRSILDAYRPKESYSDELMSNRRLADLVAVRPCTLRGTLWAADVLYVAVRNWGILMLAQQNRYLFAYSDVLNALADWGIISRTAVGSLMPLRLAKSAYRTNRIISHKAASSIFESAIQNLPADYFPTRSVTVDPGLILSNATVLPVGVPAYHRVRSLERNYLALLACQTFVNVEGFGELIKWIENPRNYSWVATQEERAVISQLQRAMRCAGRDQVKDDLLTEAA